MILSSFNVSSFIQQNELTISKGLSKFITIPINNRTPYEIDPTLMKSYPVSHLVELLIDSCQEAAHHVTRSNEVASTPNLLANLLYLLD